MNVQLIEGQFMPDDAIGIITQMIHVKIKYHENKISALNNEEDIKNREAKIKRLQKELYQVRNEILLKKAKLKIDATINID